MYYLMARERWRRQRDNPQPISFIVPRQRDNPQPFAFIVPRPISFVVLALLPDFHTPVNSS